MPVVNSDQTIIAILNNKALFFRLMDHALADYKNHALEFTISDYDALLVATTKGFNDTERRRLFDTLSIDNLERNGLLNYADRRTGRFRLQDFILQMLQHLDSKRLRELSSAELNQLMKQLEECYRQVSDTQVMWIAGDDNFEELVSSVYSSLQHIASKLKSNVRALKGQTERLATIVDEKSYIDLERSDQVRVALNEILRIHERHVTPTLQFLDERLDIRRARTELFGETAPMALLKKIIARFEERKLTDHVAKLQRIQFHILAMGREIGDIAKGLDSYVKYAEAERRRYNRTEQLYNALRGAVEEKQTGLLRDFMLRPDHPVFASARPLGGLKSFLRAQSANVNWPKSEGSFALNEILRVRLEAELNKPRVEFSGVGEPTSDAEIAQRKFIEKMLAVMADFNYEQNYDDAFLSVHQFLCEHLSDYSLKNLMDAVPFLSAKGIVELALPAAFATIEYQGLRLRYRKRCYSTRSKSHA